MHSNPYLTKIFVAEWIIKYKMKAKLITSQMFEQSWESELNMIAEVNLSLGVEQHVTVPSEVLPGYNLIWLSPANVETDFGYGTSIGTEEDSPLVVAAYRQKGSQQTYDYTLTIIALSNASRLALPNSEEEYSDRAQAIFDESLGQFECYEPQDCSYETRSGDNLAGKYAIIKVQHVVDPTRNVSYGMETYARALVWKNPQAVQENGSQYLIVVNAVDENTESLLRAISSV